MRFLADSPDIPDELLEQRDQGHVVFLCGAGVSVTSGLPSFEDLTKRVIAMLGTPSEAKSRSLYERSQEAPNLDQVFNLLQQEYRRDEVDDVVSNLLKTPRTPSVTSHSIILRLSRNRQKQPRIVTTNFDLLFERADRSLQIHVAPSLPDLSTLGSFDGVVYLHGRRSVAKRGKPQRQQLILSSSDFGRAYLADGWATRFVRDLLTNYVLVLVGYRASDPPVRYLLEGLHAKGGNPAARIYAFDRGANDEVIDRWRGLGVRALPYQATQEAPHAALWSTLAAWAVRADDPDSWRRSILDLARQSPAVLAPFQRGQVAALVRSTDGAATFASAAPPPRAEWLCVFDRLIRYANPRAEYGNEDADPLSTYGLDNDPPRPEHESTNAAPTSPGDDFIGQFPHDERTDHHRRLAGIAGRFSDPLPARLAQLSFWLTRVANEPVALWWIAGYDAIHPQLLHGIRRTVQHGQLDVLPSRGWRLLLESFQTSTEQRHDWYTFVEEIKRQGWNGQALREFERVVLPVLTASRSSTLRFRPPAADAPIQELRDIVSFEVRFPRIEEEQLEVPDEMLLTVFEVIRRGLHRGSILLSELETRYWHTASFDPEGRNNDRYLDEPSRYFHWGRSLFDRLASTHPEAAREEIRRWPHDDPYFFDKLRIYVLGKPELIDSDETVRALLALSGNAFWEEYHRRELLHTLHSRWAGLDAQGRRSLEDRILTGRARWEREEDEDYQSSRSRMSVTMLGWLQQNGCTLSSEASVRLERMRQSFPEWTPAWDERADHSLDSRAGRVVTNSDPGALAATAISEVLQAAEQWTTEWGFEFTRDAPFDGLVEQFPRRALAALSIAARQGRHPVQFWRALMIHWPKDARNRLLTACAGRLAQLPDRVVIECRYYLVSWIRDRAVLLFRASPACAYQLFDRVLTTLLAHGAQASASSLGDVTVGGKAQRLSRQTRDHAINSPAGQLVDVLFSFLGVLDPKPSIGLPEETRERLERLLLAPGDGAAHAVCETALRLRWLYNIDPVWTRNRLVPLFNPSQPLAESAWNGCLYDQYLPGHSLFRLLKPHFLKAFEVASEWRWESTRTAFGRLAERLLVACFQKEKGRRYVSFAEARIALRLGDDAGRAHAIWFLATAFAKDEWTTFGKHFVQRAWPRESRFQTPYLSQQLAFLAEQSDQNFPSVVRTILPLLVPVEQLDMTIHGLHRGDDASLAVRFPEATLQLLDRLIPIEPTMVPYQLRSIVEAIADASRRLRDDSRWKRLNIIARRE